jgi:hypothetical protein
MGFYVTVHHNNGLFKHDLLLVILEICWTYSSLQLNLLFLLSYSYFFLLLVVFSDSVGLDDCIHLGFVGSQCVWWYDGFFCVGTTVN